jgi:hypothetical protein
MFDLLSKKSSEDPEFLDDKIEGEFSLARYEPMARLMGDEDLSFLKTIPGYTPEIGRKFSRERRRIFRLYLRELAKDFSRLHAQARVVVASLSAENSPLVGMLLRQQVRFWYEMAAVEMRLSLSWAGIPCLDARGLIDTLQNMQMDISRLAAPSAA